MELSFWVLFLVSLTELTLFLLLLAFFVRLKKSEHLLVKLQTNQNTLLKNLAQNAELEKELVTSFAKRQAELHHLDQRLEERAANLQKLLEQAQAISRSPQFLRELILAGSRKGRSPAHLAKATGLSLDEVELILAEAGQ